MRGIFINESRRGKLRSHLVSVQIFLAALSWAQTVSLPEPPQVRAKNHVVSLTLHAVNENGRDAFAFDGGKVAPVIRASPGDVLKSRTSTIFLPGPRRLVR